LDERQSTRQGIVWLLKAAERGRKGGLPRNQRIAREVFAVLEGSSDVYKWVEERHRLATANRYVWFRAVQSKMRSS
jgi:small subunit ribosomal protein S7